LPTDAKKAGKRSTAMKNAVDPQASSG